MAQYGFQGSTTFQGVFPSGGRRHLKARSLKRIKSHKNKAAPPTYYRANLRKRMVGREGTNMINGKMDERLLELGYEYHCFISWPHNKIDPRLQSFVKRVKEELEKELSNQILEPRIFLDLHDIKVGEVWSSRLYSSLCKSMAMVAICTPMYYESEWCSREWTMMSDLSRKRLPRERHLSNILPIIIKRNSYKADDLPEEVLDLQYIDFSAYLIQGNAFFEEEFFKESMDKIIYQIEKIAEIIDTNTTPADCDDIKFPTNLAFNGYKRKPQRAPFREER